MTSAVIIFPFDQSLLHREFPHGGGLPSPTDLARKSTYCVGGGGVFKNFNSMDDKQQNVLKAKLTKINSIIFLELHLSFSHKGNVTFIFLCFSAI